MSDFNISYNQEFGKHHIHIDSRRSKLLQQTVNFRILDDIIIKVFFQMQVSFAQRQYTQTFHTSIYCKLYIQCSLISTWFKRQLILMHSSVCKTKKSCFDKYLKYKQMKSFMFILFLPSKILELKVKLRNVEI